MLFTLDEYKELLPLDGVYTWHFVQCPFNSYSTKPTTIMYFGVTVNPEVFLAKCPHSPRWHRYLDGEWFWAKRPMLMGK